VYSSVRANTIWRCFFDCLITVQLCSSEIRRCLCVCVCVCVCGRRSAITHRVAVLGDDLAGERSLYCDGNRLVSAREGNGPHGGPKKAALPIYRFKSF